MDSTPSGSSLRFLNPEWHTTAEGKFCIQQLHNQYDQSRKQFGILERPNVSPGTPEIAYKIGVLGKSGSGKSRTIRLLSGKQHDSSGYTETVGVHVKDVYWPSQIHGRNHLFKLQFWESGESSAKRFTYLSSVCTEKANALVLVINKADRSSLEFAESKLSILLANGSTAVAIFVIDTDQEALVGDEDLKLFAKKNQLPIFHLPSYSLDIKYLAPFYNSFCDFLYSTAQGRPSFQEDTC